MDAYDGRTILYAYATSERQRLKTPTKYDLAQPAQELTALFVLSSLLNQVVPALSLCD